LTGFSQLFWSILPVFALIGIGIGFRRFGLVGIEAEPSMIRLVLFVCFPCFAFDTVLGSPSMQNPATVAEAPVVGCLLTLLALGTAYFAGRAMGLSVGTGLRTFAFAVGIGNYAYLALPIAGGLWGAETQSVMFAHNVGIEAALWTVGILILSGQSPTQGWRKLFSPMILALVLAGILNLAGLAPRFPHWIALIVHLLGGCAIPLGLVMTGVNLSAHLRSGAELVDLRIGAAASLVRLGIIPVVFLLAARELPLSAELKRVLVVQAAMPSGVISIILAQHFSGQPLTAVRIVLATTALSLLTCPLWIQLGRTWVGV
jgi:predicted permease